MTQTYTDQELKNYLCDCAIHRYHVAHLCSCGTIVSHSQNMWNEHRRHDMLNFNPTCFTHGDSFSEIFNKTLEKKKEELQ